MGADGRQCHGAGRNDGSGRETRGEHAAGGKAAERQAAPAPVAYVIGGGDTTVTAENGGSRTYRAEWDNNKLVVTVAYKGNTPFGPTDIRMTEEWSLSDDGKTLTIVATAYTVQGEMKTKQVYSRQ